MRELEISDRAVQATYAEPLTERLPIRAIRSVLELGGPIVVAAWLRSKAADLYRRSDNVPLGRDGSGVRRVGELRDIAKWLTEAAAELDQQGGESR